MNSEIKTKIQGIKETEDITFNIEIEKENEVNFYELGYYFIEYEDKANTTYEFTMWIDIPESMFFNITAEQILDSKTPSEILDDLKSNNIIFDKDVTYSCDYGESYNVLRLYLLKSGKIINQTILEQQFEFLYEGAHNILKQLSTNKKINFNIA